MTDLGLSKLASQWIAEQDAWKDGDSENPPAIDAVIRLGHRDAPRIWEFIVEVTRQTDSPTILEILGAGPLEELIYEHGKDYFDRMFEQYRQNSRFREALKSVWIGTDEKSNVDLFSNLGCQVIGNTDA